jgi:hypothetical protein
LGGSSALWRVFSQWGVSVKSRLGQDWEETAMIGLGAQANRRKIGL